MTAPPKRRTLPPPTGADLVEELRAEAQRRGISMNKLVAPLVTSTPSNFLLCLGRSTTPMALTIARVRACIAGAPIPDARPADWGEQRRGVKHPVADDTLGPRLTGEQIAARRALTEQARATKRPGETLHDAIQRLTEGGQP